jgi:four helix bundle protein
MTETRRRIGEDGASSPVREKGKGKQERPEPGHVQPGYVQLEAWRAADDLAVALFKVTRRLEGDSRWLVTQVVRAATSAPANIAEGYGRASNKEFLQHLTVAHGSLHEVGYFIHFMRRTELLDAKTSDNLFERCQRASRILYGLMKSVRSDTMQRETQRRYLREEGEEYRADVDD